MKTTVILLICFLLNTAGVAQIEDHINNFVNDSSFRNAGISICFREVNSGEVLAEHNKEMSLVSASVMKLVTTASALEILGPDFRFTTRIGYAGRLTNNNSVLEGAVIIKGGADPCLMSGYFPGHYDNTIEEWAEAIYNTGIKRVNGPVIADAQIFDYHPAPGGWNWADLGNYYGAGTHGICVFDNMYKIHFKTGKEGSKPEIFNIQPEIPGLLIENRLSSYGERDRGYVYLEPYGEHAIIRGTIPPNRNDFVLKASIPDPPLLSAILLQSKLEEMGIEFKENATSLRLNSDLATQFKKAPKTVLHTTVSPTLQEIVTVTNNESVNLFAEQLLKYLGYVSSGREKASTSSGLDTVSGFLQTTLPATSGIYMTDGSGMSRSNSISSSFITGLLVYMKNDSKYPGIFYNSLAEASVSGTLKYYFKDPVFSGRLRAKSGTSTRVRNYAGYLNTRSGNEIAFSVLTNNFDCSSSEVTDKVEILLKKAANKL
ncbi:MAG: D-alanyl-D-alanine carboxypeptidase/D-alanyl-D-alanine-endopeptidase [Bacteroidales bacterium]|nr:D-alanyl-D-alanine carboxypeptidase/D-alanyl-D-alanine-endopeptidase [Bacteroidales bacterium]